MRTLSKREEDILVFAMRYAMQRVTAAPAIVADEIRSQMRRITRETRQQMVREIELEIVKESQFRDSDMDVGTFVTLMDDLRASIAKEAA